MKKIVFGLSLVFLMHASPVVFAQADATAKGATLIDPARGIEFNAPNGSWGISSSKYSLSLNHATVYDARVTLKKSYYTVATASDAYDQHKKGLVSYMPGAQFKEEKQALKIGDLEAFSMTYENPSDLTVIREIFFIHKGIPYQLDFRVKKENFEKVKDDFTAILTGIKLLK